MIRLSDTLRDLVRKNPLLLFGLGHGLLNLTRTATFLKTIVESRAKKEVRPAAILMGLSRLQRTLGKTSPRLEQFKLEKITIHSDLCALSYAKSADLHPKIDRLSKLINGKQGHFSITEGAHEITLLLDQDYLGDAKRIVGTRPKNANLDIASVGIQYHERYNQIPGMLYQILQQFAFQGINLLWVSSTYTEFMLYVPQSQVHLAFDTLYNSFGGHTE